MSFDRKTETMADFIFKLFDLLALELYDLLAILTDNMIMVRMLSVIGIVEFVILAEIHFPHQSAFGQQRQCPIDRGARYRLIPLTGPGQKLIGSEMLFGAES